MTMDVLNPDNTLLVSQLNGLKAFFVVDQGIGQEAIARIQAYMDHHRINGRIMQVEGGEDVKDGMTQVNRVIEEAEEFGLDRKQRMVIVGGGAVLDMAGFAASIFHRGVEHIRIPTTLLSQIDAGVGTKNAVNFLGQKNFIGVFKPPQSVLVDPSLLYTLDQRQMRSGMAEAVKVALIKDRELFEMIESKYGDVLGKDFTPASKAKEVMWRTIVAHLGQITTDPFESKLARPLDYGHEWAHRLEVVTNHRLLHGEAVAIGMAIDTFLSHKRGLITEQNF